MSQKSLTPSLKTSGITGKLKWAHNSSFVFEKISLKTVMTLTVYCSSANWSHMEPDEANDSCKRIRYSTKLKRNGTFP